MLIQETVNINNTTFKHTYSSIGNYIKQVETNALYDEAYDTDKRNFTYIETETPIETIEPEPIPDNIALE